MALVSTAPRTFIGIRLGPGSRKTCLVPRSTYRVTVVTAEPEFCASDGWSNQITQTTMAVTDKVIFEYSFIAWLLLLRCCEVTAGFLTAARNRAGFRMARQHLRSKTTRQDGQIVSRTVGPTCKSCRRRHTWSAWPAELMRSLQPLVSDRSSAKGCRELNIPHTVRPPART